MHPQYHLHYVYLEHVWEHFHVTTVALPAHVLNISLGMEAKENPLTAAQKQEIRAAFDKQDTDKSGM